MKGGEVGQKELEHFVKPLEPASFVNFRNMFQNKELHLLGQLFMTMAELSRAELSWAELKAQQKHTIKTVFPSLFYATNFEPLVFWMCSTRWHPIHPTQTNDFLSLFLDYYSSRVLFHSFFFAVTWLCSLERRPKNWPVSILRRCFSVSTLSHFCSTFFFFSRLHLWFFKRFFQMWLPRLPLYVLLRSMYSFLACLAAVLKDFPTPSWRSPEI